MEKRLLGFIVNAFSFSVALSLLAAGVLLAQRRPAPPKPPSVAWKAPIEGQPGDYVGPARCSTCHPAEAWQFEHSAHADITPAGAKMGVGCESCHGPGAAHAQAEMASEGNEAKMKEAKQLIYAFNGNPKENSERCMRCHISGKPQEEFGHSVHLSAGVSCIDCHDPHPVDLLKEVKNVSLQPAQGEFFSVPKLAAESRWQTGSMLKKPQPELCYTCHRTIQARFALPEHHRVPEGFMKCTDCHNPHGSPNHFQLTKAHWETCVKCHVEKRGPFVYEHAVVRVEGCVACHNPHGSVNNFMLKRREQRLLCLQCHTVLHTTPEVTGLHGQANVPHGRGGLQTSGPCTRCHVAIHGSNFDEYLLR